MNNGANINQEAFEKFLNLLDANREIAGQKYEAIRRRLIKFLDIRGCYIAEELADETIDRAIKKIYDMEAYIGDPVLYCYGVAKNVLLEFARGPKFRELTDIYAEIKKDIRETEEDIERLHKCLEKLKPEEQELVKSYYQETIQIKIRRKEIEKKFKITNEVLRVRIHRIKATLLKCILKLR